MRRMPNTAAPAPISPKPTFQVALRIDLIFVFMIDSFVFTHIEIRLLYGIYHNGPTLCDSDVTTSFCPQVQAGPWKSR